MLDAVPNNPPVVLGCVVVGFVAAVEEPNKPVPVFCCAPPNNPPAVAIPVVVDVDGLADVLPDPNKPAGADGCDVDVPLNQLWSVWFSNNMLRNRQCSDQGKADSCTSRREEYGKAVGWIKDAEMGNDSKVKSLTRNWRRRY